MVALLATSGCWAATIVGFLVVPTEALKLACYYAGLIVGIATVGPWLYFCSAYTGRVLHRARPLRRLAVGTFLVIVAVKLTNPLHGAYFRTEFVSTPFPHYAIENFPLHWLSMALAYALAAIGYFMLLELVWQVGHSRVPIVVLVGITGLPVVLDVLALSTPLLLGITYEPLGVAVFAVGVLYFYLGDFQSIQLAGDADDPVIVLDDADSIRDFNVQAKQLFPTLEMEQSIERAAPEIAEFIGQKSVVVEIQRAGGLRYYHLSVNPFSSDRTALGRAVTLSDVTERERYRVQLEQKNERLERFAHMVSHDLRNPLNVAMGHTKIEREERDSEHLEASMTALERMEALIEDLLMIAREGDAVEDVEAVALSSLAEDCWEVVDTTGATLEFERDITLLGDAERLQQALENLVRNAIEHGTSQQRSASGADSERIQRSEAERAAAGTAEASRESSLTVRIGALADDTGFYIADDGAGIPDEDVDSVLDSGYTTSEEGTGLGLSIVSEIVEAHGWDISVGESSDGGARFEITNVDVQS